MKMYFIQKVLQYIYSPFEIVFIITVYNEIRNSFWSKNAKRLIAFSFALFFLSFFITPVYSQHNFTQTQIDSIIKKRWDFRSIRSIYPKSEMEIIKVIKQCCPNEIDTMVTIGTTKMENEEWRSAIPWFTIVLINDPDNLLAHYRSGICKRELGRSLSFESIGLWRSSEKHFKYIIKIDPTYEDVFYQYSLLESYRQNSAKAVELINSQLEIGESYNETGKYIFQLYERLVHQESFKKTETLLKSRHTTRDIFYLAELYRINNDFEKADSIYHILQPDYDNTSATLFYLSLVRFYVQTDQPEKADEAYWLAVESVSSDLEKNLLFQDFLFIIKEKEYDLLKKDLPFVLLRKAYKTFWLDRDPMPAAPYNYRLIEHYRRLIYAEQHFRYHNPRDKKSQHKLPIQLAYPTYPLQEKILYAEWCDENHKFNDKALIYIRFGEPDEKVYAFPTPAIANAGDGPSSDLSKNMSWLYWETGNRPKLIFHFIGLSDSDSWKLVPIFSQKVIMGEFILAGWYHPTTPEQILIEGRLNDADFAFKNDFHSWPEDTEDLEMVYTLAHFRKNREEDIVQLSYAIPLSNMIDKESTSDSVSMETGFAVFDEKMNLLFKDNRYYDLQDKNDGTVWQNLFIDEFEFPMELSHYNIALHARIIGENKIGGHKYYYTLLDSTRNQLSCSSIKLVFDISSKTDLENRHRNQLTIVPNPTKLFKIDKPLYAYFEIYNLEKNSDGKTEYSINFELIQKKKKKNVFKKILGVFGGREKYQVSIKNDYSGESQTATDYMSFDISRLEEGEYELRMQVKDKVSGNVAFTKADFIMN